MAVQARDIMVKSLPLGFPVIWIVSRIGVVISIDEPEVDGCVFEGRRIRTRLILEEKALDSTVLNTLGFGFHTWHILCRNMKSRYTVLKQRPYTVIHCESHLGLKSSCSSCALRAQDRCTVGNLVGRGVWTACSSLQKLGYEKGKAELL